MLPSLHHLNLSEHTWPNYQLGLPRPARWEEAFNSDVYDNWVNPWRQGKGVGEPGGAKSEFGRWGDCPKGESTDQFE